MPKEKVLSQDTVRPFGKLRVLSKVEAQAHRPERSRRTDFVPEGESESKIPPKAGFSRLSPAIMELLSSYDWPGNIRELENEVKRLVAIKGGEAIVASDILSEKFGTKKDVNLQNLSLYQRVALLERQQILQALVESNWVKKAAASSLRIPESSLRFKIKQHKIEIPTNA